MIASQKTAFQQSAPRFIDRDLSRGITQVGLFGEFGQQLWGGESLISLKLNVPEIGLRANCVGLLTSSRDDAESHYAYADHGNDLTYRRSHRQVPP